MADETPSKINWLAMLSPEEIEAARERLAKIKREFTEVYGLQWTEAPTLSGYKRSEVTFEGYRAEATDHGPLSYWFVQQVTAGGARTTIESGESANYLIARIEAMEALVRALDTRAAVAAEALKEPEPVTGATGPTGSTGRQGPVGPPPTAPMAPGAAAPHRQVTGGPAPAMPGAVPSGIAGDDTSSRDDDSSEL